MIRRFLERLRLWFNNPLTTETARPEAHRPVRIVLPFMLHADGKVYQHTTRGDRRMDSKDVQSLVHAEYNRIVHEARGKWRMAAALRRLAGRITSTSKVLDSAKADGVS